MGVGVKWEVVEDGFMHMEHALQASLVLLVGLRTVVGGTSLLALMVLYSRFGGPTHICSADIVGNTRICLSTSE